MKRLIILTFLVGGSVFLVAQQKVLSLQPLLGIDFNYLKVENSDWSALGLANEINALEAKNNIGFSLGVAYGLRINERFSIEPQSIISFQNSQLNYDLENRASHTETIQPATLIFPVHLVFSTPQNEKLTPSIRIGGRYTFDISEEETSTRLDLKSHDFSIDLGAGFTIQLEQFYIQPAFIYSFGLSNLNSENTEEIYHSAIKSIHRDNISFRLTIGL